MDHLDPSDVLEFCRGVNTMLKDAAPFAPPALDLRSENIQ